MECPPLSPDGTRVAYKRLQEMLPRAGWSLHVLDLATGRETELAETHPVDDQAARLDDRHVLYNRAGTTWMVPADGGGRRVPWLRGAASATIVRPGRGPAAIMGDRLGGVRRGSSTPSATTIDLP